MAEIKAIITGQNNISPAIKSAEKDLTGFQSTVKKTGDALTKAFTATAVVAGIMKIASAAKDCINEFSEAEKVSLRLEKVWKNVGVATGKSYASIEKYADSIEKTTYFSGEAAKESALLLAATESLTKEGFERALDASADLAAALGKDMPSAASILAKAMEDPSSALTQLKTIGVTFTEEEKNKIKVLTEANQTYEAQEIILGKIESKYKDVAKAINDTPTGMMDNIKDVLGDINKSFGEGFVNALSPALEDIYDWLLKIKTWIDDYNEEAKNIRNQQAVNSAVGTGDISSLTSDQYKLAIDAANQKIALYEESLAELEKRRYQIGAQNYKAQKETLEGYIANARAVISNIEIAKKEAIDARKREAAANKANALAIENMFDPVYEAFDQTAYNIEHAAKAIGSDAYKAWADSVNEQYKNRNRYSNVFDAFGNYAPNINPATMGGRTTTHLPPMKIVIANPEEIGSEISTPIADKLKATDEAIAYATSSTMMDRWKAMTIAGQRQMTALGIDASASKPGKTLDEVLAEVFAEGSFKDVMASLDQAIDPLKESILYITSYLDGAAGDLANMLAAAGPLGALLWMLKEIFEAFMSQLSNLINQALDPFVEVLHWIGRELANTLAPILDLVGRWLALIGNLLQTVLGPIISLIAAPLKMIAGILDLLTPVLEGLAKTFIVLMAPVKWLADLFMWVGDVLQTFVHNITHPFNQRSYTKFSEAVGANAFTSINDQLNTVDSIGGGYGELVTTGSTTQTAVQNASYAGGTSVTINIYQQAPVVGEGGMLQFAQMIRDSFEQLDYYGISA